MEPLSESHFYQSNSVSETLTILPGNSLTFDELYAHYNQVGFLYEKKIQRLTPHLDLIRQNWERAWSAGRDLMWTLAYRENRNKAMGTVTTWRTTNGGWQAQHLTSQRNPAGVLFLLLAAQNEGMLMNYRSGQNWYSPTNTFAMRIYGGMADMLGQDKAVACLLNYLEIDPGILYHSETSLRVEECSGRDTDLIRRTAARCRGEVFCSAEELDAADVELRDLDQRYRSHGLKRNRHIWMATGEDDRTVRGLAIAYRGPFGLNFSFLENRCDLLIDPEIGEQEREEVCCLLLRAASQAYFCDAAAPDYPIGHMVVLTDNRSATTLTRLGAVTSRQYHQGIWLKSGFDLWKQYMERVFSRVLHRLDRQNRKLREVADRLEVRQGI